MERNIDNRDFERFVKQNADQYRMFPSEKVWEEIHATLHTRKRRWYVLALSLLLLTTATVTGIMFLQHKRASSGYTLLSDPDAALLVAKASGNIAQDPAGLNGPVLANAPNPFVNSPENMPQPFVYNSIPVTTNPVTATVAVPGNNQDIILVNPAEITAAPSSNPAQPPVIDQPARHTSKKPVAATQPDQNSLTSSLPATMLNAEKPAGIALQQTTTEKEAATPGKKDDSSNELAQPRIPSREIRTLTRTSAKKKAEWHVFMTPTVSYRTLSENMEYLSAARYNSIVNGTGTVSYPSDVNTMVDHRPDFGFQLGLRSSYPVSKFLRVTAGLQFSVSKYDIKAYQHPAEMTTIALSDRSVSTVSNYRNTNGTRENWLRNFYFSASIPVGLELKLSDGDKNYFGIAGTLQPTYVLDNRAWLISSDYKNYAEIPSLTRRWNMNTSFEIFAAQRTGKLNWRVGPQVRYQMMSSFTKNYPIKEHLFDFGLKLGIQLQ